MKTLLLLLLRSSAVLILVILINNTVPRLAAEISFTEGKEFWFGLPHCIHYTGELYRWGSTPVELYVSSRVNTKIYIEDAAGLSGKKTYSIPDNQQIMIPMTTELENSESEVIKPNGIHITADDPVSVHVFYTFKNTVEAFNLIPAAFLGKEYYTLNTFQDRFAFPGQNSIDRPGQILIIATDDFTKVTYKPKCETKGGIQANALKNVTLMRGETFLIEAKVKNGCQHLDLTDLTGTYIKADKPIAVLSGHTKGGYPGNPPQMTGGPMGWVNAEFIRTMLIDMLLPVEYLGKEYIAVPEKFYRRNFTGCSCNDTGYLARIVVTEDNTCIYEMRQDGSGLKKISPVLNAGQYFDLNNGAMLNPAYIKADKPVYFGHFAKAKMECNWPSDAVSGNFYLMIPLEHWGDYAAFNTIQGLENFVNITFRSDDIDNLLFDDVKFSSIFGSLINPINGTPYSYVQYNVPFGIHNIIGINGAKFSAYTYGHYDGTMDACSYGYNIGMRYNRICSDSLIIMSKTTCSDITGTVIARNIDSAAACAGIYSVECNKPETYNCTYSLNGDFVPGDTAADFSFRIIDNTKPAAASLTAISTSGMSMTKSFGYEPGDIVSKAELLDFGTLYLNERKCLSFNIKNPASHDVTIKKFSLISSAAEFDIGAIEPPPPLTLHPDEEIEIELCATALSNSITDDTITASLDCFDKSLLALKVEGGSCSLWIGDIKFGELPVGEKRQESLLITNKGKLNAEITGISWKDTIHFKIPELSLPYTITPENQLLLNVVYSTSDSNYVSDTAYITANCSEEKLYSEWSGKGYEFTDIQDEMPVTATYLMLYQNVPNPVRDIAQIRYAFNKSTHYSLILYNNLGEKIKMLAEGNIEPGDYKLNINLSELNLENGIYFYSINAEGNTITKALIHIK